MELQILWAKLEPFQSVVTHGIVTGVVSQVVYSSVLAPGNRDLLAGIIRGDQEQIVAFLGYWASLHDIGKIEFSFQAQDEVTARMLAGEGLSDSTILGNRARHEKTSEIALARIWDNQGIDRRTRRLLSSVIKAHHQGKTGEGRKGNAQWQKLQDEFETQMRHEFLGDEFSFPVIDKKGKGVVCALLLGILILSDWIASGDAFSDAETILAEPEGLQIIRDRATEFFASNGFIAEPVTWSNEFSGVWSNISRENRRPLQEETERLFSENSERIQMLLLEAPMGEGKTEAGMYAALQMQKQWRKNGFYIALPTSATSNQMVQRMRGLMEMHKLSDTVRLLHAMAWLVDEMTPERIKNAGEEENAVMNWLSPMRRGLLSPYAVGTVDQAMLAVSMSKYSVLRLLGLSNKVLIIDEIHSYDVYMGEFIKSMLQWCKALEIPVVMLSATLPPDKRKELFDIYGCTLPQKAYPRISAVTEKGNGIAQCIPPSNRRIEFDIHRSEILNSPERIAALARDVVKDGGCVCVLMNTVREAQKVYSELCSDQRCRTLLFHAQFPAERREELEKECLKLFGKDKTNRPSRAILVATQVVEQSLDVDFDAMITAVAPIDLLLQRIGRVHRHSDTKRPDALQRPAVWVLSPETHGQFGVSGVVYPKCLLQQSENLVSKRSKVNIPEDVEGLVTEGYDMSGIPLEELDSWFAMIAENVVKAAQGRGYLLSPPDKEFSPVFDDPVFEDDQDNSYLSVKTRLGEPTVRIALLEKKLYDCICEISEERNGIRYAPVKKKWLAQEVLKWCVSVPQRRVKELMSGTLDIKGDKLLSGVIMFPSQDGIFGDPSSGKEICYDYEYGILIKEEVH